MEQRATLVAEVIQAPGLKDSAQETLGSKQGMTVRDADVKEIEE